MEIFDIEECLKSMIVLVDTREQKSERAERRYKAFGTPYQRQHLDYGDYTYNFKLPSGEWLYKMGDSVIHPDVSIERKMSLTELSHNIIQDKKTFEAEFGRAETYGATCYLVIENGCMEHAYNGNYKTKVHPHAFTSAMWAIIARHGIKGPIFCKAETSGKVIHDILYRELKARLERGDYG